MTPWKHSESTVARWGGKASDYIEIHNWLDETKQYTGDWRHRALRHHSAGVQWAIDVFGHSLVNSDGKHVPVKMIVEKHITEDCGYIPTPSDYLLPLLKHPEPWMLRVKMKSHEIPLEISE